MVQRPLNWKGSTLVPPGWPSVRLKGRTPILGDALMAFGDLPRWRSRVLCADLHCLGELKAQAADHLDSLHPAGYVEIIEWKPGQYRIVIVRYPAVFTLAEGILTHRHRPPPRRRAGFSGDDRALRVLVHGGIDPFTRQPYAPLRADDDREGRRRAGPLQVLHRHQLPIAFRCPICDGVSVIAPEVTPLTRTVA